MVFLVQSLNNIGITTLFFRLVKDFYGELSINWSVWEII